MKTQILQTIFLIEFTKMPQQFRNEISYRSFFSLFGFSARVNRYN